MALGQINTVNLGNNPQGDRYGMIAPSSGADLRFEAADLVGGTEMTDKEFAEIRGKKCHFDETNDAVGHRATHVRIL